MKKLAWLVLGLTLSGCAPAYASDIDFQKLADAIYKAEGGAKTRHPYGILKKYKVTTPRQACLNTINTSYKRWNGKGSFIEHLGKTYCPIGASNDPTGLNRHWVKNVTYFYGRSV